jgi:hypothetical protein
VNVGSAENSTLCFMHKSCRGPNVMVHRGLLAQAVYCEGRLVHAVKIEVLG